LTTGLGFLTFVTTNSDKLVQFGIVAAANIMMVFILSICLIPIIVSISKTPKQRHLMHLERKLAVRLIETLVHITVNHRRWVYIAMVVVIGMSVWGITRIKVSGNITSDLPEGHQILTDLQFLQNEF